MTFRIQLTFIFVLATNLLFGQIFLAFHLNDTLDIKNKNVTEISEELKIGNGGVKFLKTTNDKNQIISDERHDNKGKFIAKFTYTYDSLTGLKKSETKESVDKSGSPSISSMKYEYSAEGWLRKIIYLSSNGVIYQTAHVTNNEKGHPIKIEIFSETGVLTSSETADYKYKENKATFDQIDSNGKIFYSSFFTLDDKKDMTISKPGFVYDNKGNLIKTPDGFNEIVYDQYENWTSIKRYRKVNGVDKLTQELTRVLTYSK